MQILDIVVYGDGDKIRRLPLKPGSLNIITGASKTGKSSLIQIVEYCLGRGECHVADGIITNNARWYGLRLLFPSKQIFIARRAPVYGRKSNSEMFVDMGTTVGIPRNDELVGTDTVESLATFLSELMGISPNLHEPSEGHTRLPLAANIKHGFFFTFQEQSEVANPTLLFHRQGEPGIALAIRDTLPYFLGAVAEDHLSKMNELREAKRVLAQAEKRIKEAEALRGGTNGLSTGLGIWATAAEAGLIPSGTTPTTLPELRERLRPALEWVGAELPAVPGEASAQTEDEYLRLLAETRTIREQMRAARECYVGQKGYEFEAGEQRARLAFVGLYQPPIDEASPTVCPICESTLETPTPSARDLERSLARMNKQLTTVAREEPRLLDYINSAERRLNDVKQQLVDVRGQMSALVAQQPSIGQQLLSNAMLGRIVGGIELYLRNMPDAIETVDKEQAVADAKQRVLLLQDALNEMDAEEMLPSILNIIGQRIALYAKQLDLEYSDAPIRFDTVNLQIVAATEQRPVPLRRMGSGANWVGYHLAAHFALHHWFVQRNRPVPRFLFLDQPTQVYYPQDRDKDGSLDALEEDDREAVKTMFHWLADATDELSPEFQVIVTDHADLRDEDWFQERIVRGVDGQPERWRRGRKLIPIEWLDGE
jgi:hypothetical protein